VLISVLLAQALVVLQHCVDARFLTPPANLSLLQQRLVASKGDDVLVRDGYKLRVALLALFPDNGGNLIRGPEDLAHQRLQVPDFVVINGHKDRTVVP